jgi:hypothetical protein
MFFASKIVCSGIVLLLMTPWTSRLYPMPLDSDTKLSEQVADDGRDTRAPEETLGDNVKAMQHTLQDRGHYHGKIDGVFGLRTRASIREFQKAENLPVTGQLDVQTAGKLEVRPELQIATSDESTQDKPSAGITWADGSRRSGRAPRKPAKKWARTVPPA